VGVGSKVESVGIEQAEKLTTGGREGKNKIR